LQEDLPSNWTIGQKIVAVGLLIGSIFIVWALARHLIYEVLPEEIAAGLGFLMMALSFGYLLWEHLLRKIRDKRPTTTGREELIGPDLCGLRAPKSEESPRDFLHSSIAAARARRRQETGELLIGRRAAAGGKRR
jgi:hypothetical protein